MRRFEASRFDRLMGEVRWALRYLPDLLTGIAMLGGALVLIPILTAFMRG